MHKRGLTPLNKIKNSRTGLTLMEIIVSMILIALTLSGLINLFVAGRAYIQYSRTRMTGGELGKVFLDPLHMDVREDQWGSNCLSNPPTNCPTEQTIDNVKYTPTYDIAPVAGTDLRRVKLTINWPRVQP